MSYFILTNNFISCISSLQPFYQPIRIFKEKKQYSCEDSFKKSVPEEGALVRR